MTVTNSFLFIPFSKIKYFYNESAKLTDVIIVDFEDSVEYKSSDVNTDEIKKAFEHVSGKMHIVRIAAEV